MDRLAGAMETLGKREGKALTPKQRVAAAQRFESLGHIADDRLNEYRDTFGMDFLKRDRRHAIKNGLDNADYGDELWGFMDLGLIDETDPQNIARNPFLSKIPAKYDEQAGFLAWCRDQGVPPTPQTLKQFRWETYQTLPERQRVWIANKDAIKSYLGPEMWHYDEKELDRINTIDELEEYLQTRHPEDGWPAHYPLYNDEVTPVYESIEEFPDDFDYMWRY